MVDDVTATVRPLAPVHDEAWFDGVFRAHAPAVYRYLRRRAPQQDVEDLAAEVLVTAWRRRDDVPDGYVLPWLYRTAGFVLANHRRRRHPSPVEDVPERSGQPVGADPADVVVEDEELARVLATLSARDREVLLLFAWEDLDGEALGRVLGMTPGGAASALSRARSHLRAAWETAPRT